MELVLSKEFACDICGCRKNLSLLDGILESALTFKNKVSLEAASLDPGCVCEECHDLWDHGLIVNLVAIR